MPRYIRYTLLFVTFYFRLPLSPGYTECVSISIVNDEVIEPDIEQFTISVSSTDASVSIQGVTAYVFIFDDDGGKLCIEM